MVSSGGNLNIEMDHKGEIKTFNSEKISPLVLEKIKKTAKVYLGGKMTDAVVNVFAHFSDLQRQATKDAGRISNLNVFHTVSEPTAAALAYGLSNKTNGKHNILIFDPEGGTCDVSIMTVSEGSMFEVQSTAEYTHQGGEDFDIRLVTHFTEDFQRKHRKDIKGNLRAVRRLRTSCKRVNRIWLI